MFSDVGRAAGREALADRHTNRLSTDAVTLAAGRRPWPSRPGRIVGELGDGAARDGVLVEEARRLAVAVRVVARTRAVVVAPRHVDRELATRARQPDVEQASLLVDLLDRAGRHARREVAVVGGDQVHGLPLEALGRVDGREDEPVVVEVRRPGEVTRRRGRVEHQLGDERAQVAVPARPGRRARRDR